MLGQGPGDFQPPLAEGTRGLVNAARLRLARDGLTLLEVWYGLVLALGVDPLRDFLVGKLKADAGITCSAMSARM